MSKAVQIKNDNKYEKFAGQWVEADGYSGSGGIRVTINGQKVDIRIEAITEDSHRRFNKDLQKEGKL